MNQSYSEKPIQYFSNVRHDLISLIPASGVERVLEIGAGGGDTILNLKQTGRAKEVTGIELMQIENSNQRNPIIDHFFFGNIEIDNFDLPKNHFDVIICGDVLEHLLDPWSVVKQLSELLRPMGRLIISCPNIRHFSGFIEIFVKGRFPYKDQGLFDKTHFRFFCKSNLIELAQSGGLRLSNSTPLFKLARSGRSYYINMITLGLFEELLSLQYAVVVEKIQ
jgi:2-polyprenyl-3-methyl-5-hydroxy-6-metoxy-1,4-benzoquinol methylase